MVNHANRNRCQRKKRRAASAEPALDPATPLLPGPSFRLDALPPPPPMHSPMMAALRASMDSGLTLELGAESAITLEDVDQFVQQLFALCDAPATSCI